MSSFLTCEHSPTRIALERSGMVLVQNAPTGARPYIHPWMAPDGQGELTENVPPHHPWQHGLYIGFSKVNGVDFWTEGLKAGRTAGSFDPEPMAAPVVNGDTAEWEVRTIWRGPDGAAMMREIQHWKLEGADTLDLAWTAEGIVSCHFAKYPYGGLFLRMPWREDAEAAVLTSEGITDQKQAEQQRARWVAVSMLLSGRSTPAGVAILDHPGNAGHPRAWRIDHQFGMNPSPCIADDWRVEPGERRTDRFRLISFAGRPDAKRIEGEWQKFIQS